MAIGVPQGLNIGNSDAADNRTHFDTVALALAGIGRARRSDKYAVYITSEQKYYRFVGGVDDANFVLDPAIGAGTGDGGGELLWLVS